VIEPRPDLLPEIIAAAQERWEALSPDERIAEAQRIFVNVMRRAREDSKK
jgi:hypothetical protein